MTYYGFYSETQKEVQGKVFFYLNPAGKKVCVTEVRKEKESHFPDAVCVGQVLKFLGSGECSCFTPQPSPFPPPKPEMSGLNLNLFIKEAIQEGNLHALRFLCKRFPKGAFLFPIVVEIAAMHGHVDIVRYLVEEADIDPNSADTDGWTALHFAAYNGHLDVVRYLVEEAKVQDPNKPNKDGCTPIHVAVAYGRVNVVKYLVEEAKVKDPNKADNGGATPINIADANGHKELSGYLYDALRADSS